MTKTKLATERININHRLCEPRSVNSGLRAWLKKKSDCIDEALGKPSLQAVEFQTKIYFKFWIIIIRYNVEKLHSTSNTGGSPFMSVFFMSSLIYVIISYLVHFKTGCVIFLSQH